MVRAALDIIVVTTPVVTLFRVYGASRARWLLIAEIILLPDKNVKIVFAQRQRQRPRLVRIVIITGKR